MKKKIKSFLKRHPSLRVLARILNTRLKRIKYRHIIKTTPVDDKLILFETFMGRQYSCNPRAIYEYMIGDGRFNEYRFIWVLKDESRREDFEALQRADTVRYKSKRYYRCCASAKYFITNSNLDYSIIKRPEQIFIQTWHGTPLKRLRCDITAEYGNANNTLQEIKMKNDIDVVRYDYFLSPSSFATERFISAFNLIELGKSDIMIETGYPRNDLLSNYTAEEVRSIRHKLGIDAGKKVILYAPTFRDNQHEAGQGYTYDLHLDFDRLHDVLGDDYVILFRAHYFVASIFDFQRYGDFIIDVSKIDDITELYLISDLLITDYSSVFFDYAVLKRPILFYMYDLDEYRDDIRGFYLDLESLPGKIITEEDQLPCEILRTMQHWQYDEKYRTFNETFNDLEDGKASERLVAQIIDDN